MKNLKKFLISLSALPLSAFTIILIYAFVYVFLGEKAYINQINQITDFNILLKIYSIITISIFITIISFIILKDTINSQKLKVGVKLIFLIILALIIAVIPFALIKIFLNDMLVFQTVFIILWLIFIATASLILALKDFIDVWIINKKIKN